MNCEVCGKPARFATIEDVTFRPNLVGEPIHETGLFSCNGIGKPHATISTNCIEEEMNEVNSGD